MCLVYSGVAQLVERGSDKAEVSWVQSPLPELKSNNLIFKKIFDIINI